MYKRFPIKLWESTCKGCCIECDLFHDCNDSCGDNEITCNQCKHGNE